MLSRAILDTSHNLHFSHSFLPGPTCHKVSSITLPRQYGVDLGLRDLRRASEDDDLIGAMIAALSYGKGLPMLGRMAMLTKEERKQMLDEVGWG